MEGDDGIGIGGDDIGTGCNELVMHLADRVRRLHQRERGPFRLPEGRAVFCKLTPQSTVENDHQPVPFTKNNAVLKASSLCPANVKREA